MKFGVVFPQTEFPADPNLIREYAQTVEALGYSHVLAYDHVLGANPQRPGGWRGPYAYTDSFFEPFVLFSHMAAAARQLGFIPGVLILPQRQTALVAKQAAILDVLCEGRLRLGVGTGWNQVEYQALNQDFHTRGRRQEEQIRLMRQLWTQELVEFQGRWDHIPDAGLNPLPVQRPIPIWLGGYVDAVLRRVAVLGDGWLPGHARADSAREDLEKLDRYLEEAGRSRQEIGLEARIHYRQGDLDALLAAAEEWQQTGATHLSLNTMRSDLRTPGEHLAALRAFAEARRLSGG